MKGFFSFCNFENVKMQARSAHSVRLCCDCRWKDECEAGKLLSACVRVCVAFILHVMCVWFPDQQLIRVSTTRASGS